MTSKVVRRPEVQVRTGLSRSSIYAKMQDGTFPIPIKLGIRAVGWLEADIEGWLAARKSERDAA